MFKIGDKIIVTKNCFSECDNWIIRKTGIIIDVTNFDLIQVIWYLIKFDNNKHLMLRDKEIELYIDKYNSIKIILKNQN